MTQDEALLVLKTGHNVFLTGAAGSGKTFLLNQFVQYLKEKGINVAVTASTGIAATHMEGITIHSWAGIGIAQTASDKEIKAIVAKKQIADRFRKTQTLIIDEVSMFDADRFDLLEKVARFARGSWEPFGGMQVVLCGDFFQLPPVAAFNSDEPLPRFLFESANWGNMDLKVCYLHEQFRQGDEEFLGILNAIRDASVGEKEVDRLHKTANNTFSSKDLNRVVKLYSHNVNVDAENERELAKLSGEEHRYQMQMSGVKLTAEALKRGCLAPETLVLKKDAAVMFVKNNYEKGYVNGTLGKVSGFNEKGFPVIKLLNNKTIHAETATWSVEENGMIRAQTKQIPLRLAWAITVHKSQGMTLDAAQVDLTRCFESGMGYVALSRVRSLDGLQVLGFNDLALQVNEETLSFDQELKKKSEEVLREIKPVPENQIHKEETQQKYSVETLKETYPSAYQPWTLSDEDRLASGFRSGKSINELSQMLGRKVGGIRSRLKKLNLIPGGETGESKSLPEITSEREEIRKRIQIRLKKKGLL